MAAEVGLKAQKLLAQGIALGNVDKKWSRPETQGVELQPEEVNVRLGRVSGKKAQKMKGTTAIPVSGCIAWIFRILGLFYNIKTGNPLLLSKIKVINQK